MKPNFEYYENIEKEIEEDIISKVTVPIETYLRFGMRYTAYDCTMENKYQKEMEQLEEDFNNNGYHTMFKTALPDNKTKITFKL